MKKFLGITSTLAVLVMAAFLALGWADIQVTVPAWAENAFSSISQPRAAQTGTRTASSNTNGAAQQALSEEDEALAAAKDIAKKMMNYLQTDNKKAYFDLVQSAGTIDKNHWMSSLLDFSFMKNAVSGANKVNVAMVCQYQDIYYSCIVYYRVIGAYTNDYDCNANISFLPIKKIDGKWRIYQPNDNETNGLISSVYNRFPKGFQDALKAKRNYFTGDYMWIDPTIVYDGIFDATVAYMYQNKDKSVDIGISFKNGTNQIKSISWISIKATDERLGEVISLKKEINDAVIALSPGQTYVYNIHLNGNQLKKNGKWGAIKTLVNYKY